MILLFNSVGGRYFVRMVNFQMDIFSENLIWFEIFFMYDILNSEQDIKKVLINC